MDKEKVIDELEECLELLKCIGTEEQCKKYVLNALTFLKEQEDVVRCKDCRYCVEEPNGEMYCDILATGYEPLGSKKVDSGWFCADGERG